MKREKASNIYFAVTHFTVQCTCSEKIYTFTLKVKIDHQLILSPGPPTGIKPGMAPPASGFLEHCICAEDKKNGVLKKRVHPVPKIGTGEVLI